MQREIDDPRTPPDLKTALVQLKKVSMGSTPTFDQRQMKAISILQRHRDAFPIDVVHMDGVLGRIRNIPSLQEKIDDPNTPPDLRAALIQVRDDPTFEVGRN